MKVISTNIGEKKIITWQNKDVSTGIYKVPVDSGIILGKNKVKGDEISSKKVHGGEFMACYMFSFDEYDYWKEHYPQLNWTYGMFGENLTVEGLNEKEIYVGDIFEVGNAKVQITIPREPCYKFGVKFGNQNVIQQFIERGFSGTYLKVIEEGLVQPEDKLKLIDQSNEKVSTWEFYNLIYSSEKNKEVIEKLIKNDSVSAKKKKSLSKFI